MHTHNANVYTVPTSFTSHTSQSLNGTSLRTLSQKFFKSLLYFPFFNDPSFNPFSLFCFSTLSYPRKVFHYIFPSLSKEHFKTLFKIFSHLRKVFQRFPHPRKNILKLFSKIILFFISPSFNSFSLFCFPTLSIQIPSFNPQTSSDLPLSSHHLADQFKRTSKNLPKKNISQNILRKIILSSTFSNIFPTSKHISKYLFWLFSLEKNVSKSMSECRFSVLPRGSLEGEQYQELYRVLYWEL